MFREKEVGLPVDVTDRHVDMLRRRGGAREAAVADKLEDVVRLTRTRDMLLRRRRLHEKKVDVLHRTASRRAERAPPMESEWEANGNAVQVLGITDSLEACWRIEGGTRMMLGEIDKLAARIDEVSAELRGLRESVFALVRSGDADSDAGT